MILPDEFDAFYQRARNRLLLQTYALTGDLPAARSAVRDSFVVTWHQWRKVNRLPDPEAWVRPQAWARAQRRHTARIWRRDQHLDPEVKATLDALSGLSLSQRKALLLQHLTDLSPDERARELGVPGPEAEQLAGSATARFVAARDITEPDVVGVLDGLRATVEGASWPRASIVRRAGAARRRTHTLVGAVVAVAAVVVSGTVVSGAAVDRDGDVPAAGAPSGEDAQSMAAFDADRLLSADALALLVDGRGWHETDTTDNTGGDGLATPCQAERFADPDGLSALVRTFDTSPRRKESRASAVQTAELSASSAASRRAWHRTLRWYGGCVEPRVQLVSTFTVKGVGDDARLFHLRHWRPSASYVVGVARTGGITTTTFTRTTAGGSPDLRASARLLGRAVNGLCAATSEARCARSEPRLVAAPPIEVGEVPGLLVEADLPPVAGVGKPWVGTPAAQARQNTAATSCDRTDFSRKPVSNGVTRTFLVPGARLPAAFGLTETVGTLPEPRAREFVRTVRARMASCSDRDLGADVTTLRNVATRDRDLSIWRVTSEVNDRDSVTYLMGIARSGTAVGQLGFVPGGGAALDPRSFEWLLRRAADRLEYLPRPKR